MLGGLGRKILARATQAVDAYSDSLVDEFMRENEDHAIAAYFNNRLRDIPGYTVSVYRKDDCCDELLGMPEPVTDETVKKVRAYRGVYLQGSAYVDGTDLVTDTFDSDSPAVIVAVWGPSTEVVEVRGLDQQELNRRRARRSVGPKATVVAVDDIDDIPLGR